MSRQKLRPGELMLNRQTVFQIWDLFGKAEVDLFASQESSQCPLWFSLSFPMTLGIDAFAHPWPNVSLYAFPPIKLYSSKWGVFESWCLARAIDPVNCPVGPVLEFLQERLTAGAATTTLRVYVTAIAARRELDEIPLGRHRMVSAFMRGVRRLRPVRPTAVPSWDLSVVVEGLVTAPFEPLESASEWILTLKVTLLLALTSLKKELEICRPSLLVRRVWTLPRV